MSLLADLLAEEKIPAVKIQPEKISVASPAETPRDIADQDATILDACSACGGFLFWHSKYDRTLHCMGCEPDPPRGLLGGVIDRTPGRAPGPQTEPDDSRPIGGAHCDCGCGHRRQHVAQHFPPWPDWSRNPGSWRRELPDEADDNLATDPGSDAWRKSRSSPEMQPHKDPDPGCLRDYRGKGGSCLHPLAVTANTQPGDRITCPSCKKFIGYKREEKRPKSAATSVSAVDV